MSNYLVSFSTSDKEIIEILERASKYNKRSALINAALKSVDLEALLSSMIGEQSGNTYEVRKIEKKDTSLEKKEEEKSKTNTNLSEFEDLV